ncbi:MAG: DUF3078 domain-containing protein [Ignavibacterium sp.]|nr:MAG: DUF3078 domain-containing protein [Ignavibacterium sp.]
MKIIRILLITFLLTITIMAQDEEKKDTLWTPSGGIGLNLSQVAFENWSQGGENSIAFTLFTLLGLDYIGDPWKWKNMLKVTYGRTKVGDQEYRTNDNEIFFESLLIYHVNWEISPYAGLTARTAVTKGFDYSVDPALQIVDFLDPLYLTQGLGFIYDKLENFSFRLGVGFKQTFAKDFSPRYTDDPETPNEVEDFKFESGIESVTTYKVQFLGNMEYYTYLRLFGRFEDISVWDVRWDNLLVAKINDYFNVNFNLLLIHDIDETRRTQIKEALQLGVSFTLF